MTAEKQISAAEFDKIFDEGKEDIMCYLDLDSAVRINAPDAANASATNTSTSASTSISACAEENTQVKRVNVDFPVWMVDALDKQANRLAINRQAVIKTWIAEKLQSV